ncbi:unnamed protein product [Mytilus edulis]|uniref:CARD domain-containing protein n=1 Tax=Mytilus edulis TaxID=6550 RepID=A0A8S3QUC1_MYTED|nr:unnamed protein product [Mytilus edulis]
MVWEINKIITDAADAKSKVLDHNTFRNLVNIDNSIQHNLKRLNENSNELADQSVKNKETRIKCRKRVDKQTVKLIKWYKILVHDLDIDKPGILAKLSAKDLISQNNNLVLTAEERTSKEKIRTLLGEIIRKNASSTYTAFLEFLKEDSQYVQYASKLEDTEISQFDQELLFIGRLFNKTFKHNNRK